MGVYSYEQYRKGVNIMEKCRKPCEETVTIDRSCCISDTGCSFNGCLDGVVGEYIFVDKVYDG